jgi:hypothetical protein
MPASWEQINTAPINHNRVLGCILTRETVSTAWAFGFRNIHMPNGAWTALSGMPFGHARDTGGLKLLELGWEWLFFLDDDVICPPDTILKLLSHNKPIVSGVYYRRYAPLAPVMLLDSAIGPQWITEYPANSLIKVDYVGAGCLLIHRSVLESLPPLSTSAHWFEWRCNRTDLPHLEKTSEDFTFCKHARNHGFEIFVDTSIQCQHCGQASSNIEGFKPLEIKP